MNLDENSVIEHKKVKMNMEMLIENFSNCLRQIVENFGPCVICDYRVKGIIADKFGSDHLFYNYVRIAVEYEIGKKIFEEYQKENDIDAFFVDGLSDVLVSKALLDKSTAENIVNSFIHSVSTSREKIISYKKNDNSEIKVDFHENKTFMIVNSICLQMKYDENKKMYVGYFPLPEIFYKVKKETLSRQKKFSEEIRQFLENDWNCFSTLLNTSDSIPSRPDYKNLERIVFQCFVSHLNKSSNVDLEIMDEDKYSVLLKDSLKGNFLLKKCWLFIRNKFFRDVKGDVTI